MRPLSALLRALAWGLALLLVLVAGIQLWYVGHVAWWTRHDPAETAFMRRELARLKQADPKAALAHQWVPYDRISVHLKRSVVAAEDARFLEHEGIDWDAVTQAYEDNRKGGRRVVRGGSTISQQLAKNLFLSPDRSYVRKAQELLITWMIEALWDKRRILEVYLNVAEWGNGVFGAEAAARHYHGTSAAQLGPEAAARMAAMLPRPRFFDRNRNVPYLSSRGAVIQRYAAMVKVP